MNKKQLTKFYDHIGGRIRAARAAKGITQEKLAAAMGISRPSLANIEAGRQRISADQLAVLADSLGIDVADLLPA